MPDGPTASAFEVNTADLRAESRALGGRASALGTPINDVNAISIAPGDPAVIPGAATLTTAVEGRKGELGTYLGNLRTDLETLGTNTLRVADMYDSTEDEAAQAAQDVTPVINEGL